MNVAIAVRHPEHVRFFRHAVAELRERGHDVTVLARDHAGTAALLAREGIPHTVVAGESSTAVGLVAGHLGFEARLLAHAVRRNVDVLTSVGGRAVTHVAPLAGARSVVFLDWVPSRVDRVVAALADTVCTPSYLAGTFGERQVVYDGVPELASLDPRRDGGGVLHQDVGGAPRRNADGDPRRADGSTDPLSIPDEPYAVLGVRDPTSAGAWYEAVRDRLARHGRVALVSVSGADEHAAVDRRYVEGDDAVRTLLARASVCVSALGTTATEAAVLGTPSVYVGDDLPARCRHLRDEYGLVVSTSAVTATESAVEELLTDGSTRERWRRRQRRLLDEADDVTERIVAALLDGHDPS